MLRLLIIFGGMILLVSNAYATPSFARQMNTSCATCHSQNGFPSLNAFGRKFKASGFTLMEQQGVIESSTDTNDSEKGNLLSLPDTLNASFLVKIRAQDGDHSKSELDFPDEAAVIFGGRVAKHIGTFVEIGYSSDEDKFTLANFKLPMTYEFNEYTLGLVPYRTDGFGPAASFDVFNTGSVSAKVLDDEETISAQQYIGTATEAEGLGIYLYTDLWHIVYSAYMPTMGTVSDYSPAHYFRAAVTPTVGTWDLGFGVQVWSGTAEYNKDDVPFKAKTDAYAVDFQAMGNVNDIPLSFFATYAKAKNSTDSLYNMGVDDKYAATFLTEVGVIPSIFNLSAGFRIADNGQAIDSSEDKAIIGAKYFIVQNLQLQLNYTYDFDALPDNDKNHVLFILQGGF